MNRMPIPDEQIIKNVILGDIDSFKIIVNRYQKQIYSIGMRFFKNEEDSYDFAQEVFIKVYQNLASYKEKAPFHYWLTRIAYNYGINKFNIKKIEEVTSDQSIIVSSEQTPENDHIKNEVKGILLDAMEELPENYKLCLDFYFFLDLSYIQIHEITGEPVNTIKSNVLRAKKLLRNALKGTIAEDYYEM